MFYKDTETRVLNFDGLYFIWRWQKQKTSSEVINYNRKKQILLVLSLNVADSIFLFFIRLLTVDNTVLKCPKTGNGMREREKVWDDE